MKYNLGFSVQVLLLLTVLPSQTSASNTKIVSHEEFSAVRRSFIRTLPSYFSQNINLTTCTQIFIHDATEHLLITQGLPSIIVSDIWSINKPTKVLQHSSQCSVVSIMNAVTAIEESDEHWLQYISGTFFNSFHFILASHNVLDWMWDRPFVRRLANVVAFVQRSQKIWDLITPNRYNGKPRYFHVGHFHKGVLNLSLENGIFWNKWWDMEGVQLKLAVPPLLSEETFRLQAEGKELLYGITEAVEVFRYLNSTPKVISMPIGGTKFPNGSWDGYIGKVIDDTVDISFPYYTNPEQYAAVFISQPTVCSQLKFFTPLPKKNIAYFNSLTKPLDAAIWTALFLCIISCAVVVYILKNINEPSIFRQLFTLKLLPKRLKRVLRICTYFSRMLVDQSMPPSATTFLDRIVGYRWVFVAWFFTVTVIGCAYKSVVVAVFVKPDYVYPPQTFSELIESDFQVNAPMYKTAVAGVLDWKDQLAHPIKEFGFDFRGCLRTLLEENNVCLFLHHWLYLDAAHELIDGSGNQLYRVSKEAVSAVYNSYYISQRNAQLQAAIDKVVDTVTEGGLLALWTRQTFYYFFLKTVRKQQKLHPQASRADIEKADITFIMQYPLLIVIKGYIVALFCHIIVEFYWWHSKQSRPNSSEVDVESCAADSEEKQPAEELSLEIINESVEEPLSVQLVEFKASSPEPLKILEVVTAEVHAVPESEQDNEAKIVDL